MLRESTQSTQTGYESFFFLKFEKRGGDVWKPKSLLSATKTTSTPVWWGTWWASRGVCLFHWRGSSPACRHGASPSQQTLSLGSQTCTPGSRCLSDVNPGRGLWGGKEEGRSCQMFEKWGDWIWCEKVRKRNRMPQRHLTQGKDVMSEP